MRYIFTLSCLFIKGQSFVLLDSARTISMQDCIHLDDHSEICQCDWIVHIEENSAVSSTLLVTVP